MSFMDLFSDKNEQKAADALKAGFQTGKTDAYGEIDKGVASANTDYAAALGLYQPLADTYGKGSSMYADALGLGGADGNARATSAYQTGPGYQFSLDQALQAVERRAGAQGQLGSGQTGIDTINTAHGIANQDYGNWLERLSGYDGKALGAADSQANIYGGMAGMDYNAGNAKAGYGWNAATGQAQAQAGYEAGKDQTGANIIGAALGGVSSAAKMFSGGGFTQPTGLMY
jgi:hypothetical protein